MHTTSWILEASITTAEAKTLDYNSSIPFKDVEATPQNVSKSLFSNFLYPLSHSPEDKVQNSNVDSFLFSNKSFMDEFLQEMSPSSLLSPSSNHDLQSVWSKSQGHESPEVTTLSQFPLLLYHTWNYTWGFHNWSFGNMSQEDYDAFMGREDLQPTLNTPRAVFTGLILGLICLMTISGNILVLVAVFVNSHLRGTTHYFIANLAVADLLLGTTVLPFSATLEVADGHWYFGQLFCDVWAAVDVLCCTASIMSLCVISIDRYIGVTRPLQHSTIMSERRAACIILLIWILSMTISIAPLLGWKEPPPENPYECLVTTELGYVLFSVSGSFYIPLAIILVVYFRVYREALSQSRFLATGVKKSKSDEHKEITLRIHTGRPSMPSPNVNSTSSPNCHKKSGTSPSYQSSSSSEHSQGSGKKNHKLTLAGKIAKFNREKKAAKTLGIVVGVFILCWFPFFFFLPLGALCQKCQPPEWFFKVIFWLGYCNSTMNPIIYAMSSREFKRAFIRILRCRCRRRPRSFLWDGTSSPTTTEMNKLYSTVRRFTKNDISSCKSTLAVSSKTKNRRHGRTVRGGMFFGSANNQNNRGALDLESPLCSLNLLQDKQRKETSETVIISDDESAIIEQSDDDKSDLENETVIVSFPRTPTTATEEAEGTETERLMKEHKGLWEEDKISFNVPDVVINCDDDDDDDDDDDNDDLQSPTDNGEESSWGATNGPLQPSADVYQDDRIMWL